MARLLVWVAVGALGLSPACASKQPGAEQAQAAQAELRLSVESDAPALFLGPERESPVIGFLGKDVPLELAGPSENGRVPVRIRGALWTRAYVPEELLVLRVQRAGRVRGTPVFLGPNDVVNVLGPGDKPGRVRVRAVPMLAGKALSAFEGTYPAVGLAAQLATASEIEPRGEAFELPAQSTLVLYDKPDGEKQLELPAAPAPLPLRVLSSANGWSAVRVGEGPYVVGYTNAPLQRGAEGAAPAAHSESAAQGMPARLARENGVLKRVANGAKISFGTRVIARLHQPGLARVLATYPSGEVDALIAVNDEVTVRGLVLGSALTPYAGP